MSIMRNVVWGSPRDVIGGLRNRSKWVQSPIALFRLLSDKFTWESYEPTYLPCYWLNSTTGVFFSRRKALALNNVHRWECQRNQTKNLEKYEITRIVSIVKAINNHKDLVGLGWVLWHINHCWLFSAKSGLYTYIRYTVARQNNGNPRNFKQFYFICFSDCSLPVKCGFVQLPSNSFWGNWVLGMVIKLCCNIRSWIIVILPNNPRKNPTVLFRLLSLSSRVLLQWWGFSFFPKCCHFFRDNTPWYIK